MSLPQKIHEPIQTNFADVLGAIAEEQRPEVENIGARPFLKWVGGKRSILPELIQRMPAHYGAYHEGFVGGGALFFAVQPTKASLSDINFALILTYQAVRDDVEKLISLLRMHQRLHSQEYFSKARDKLSTEREPVKIAALFIYLNKTCFNGLYRVNKAGKFNVPIGSYKDPVLFEEDVLRNDAKVLEDVTIMQRPFGQLDVVREDFYYFDPPYHKTYDGYNGGGFDDEQHRKLSELCAEIHGAKGYFMLSNSDTPFVRGLYSKFNIEVISASRSVSCKGDQRGKENELIIRNYSK
jgi:DNA adenine methylase